MVLLRGLNLTQDNVKMKFPEHGSWTLFCEMPFQTTGRNIITKFTLEA